MIEERLVTIEEVNHPYAVVRDQGGTTFEVPTSILPVRGKVPRPGERWIVTRDLRPGWHWVAYIDVTGQGGSTYREVVGDGAATVFTITHGLGTMAVIAQVRTVQGDGSEVVTSVPTITVLDETRVEIDFGASPPALDGAAVVVMSV